jgi:hypothetical protein
LGELYFKKNELPAIQQNAEVSIDVSSFSSGVYVIQLKQGGVVANVKFIKE